MSAGPLHAAGLISLAMLIVLLSPREPPGSIRWPLRVAQAPGTWPVPASSGRHAASCHCYRTAGRPGHFAHLRSANAAVASLPVSSLMSRGLPRIPGAKPSEPARKRPWQASLAVRAEGLLQFDSFNTSVSSRRGADLALPQVAFDNHMLRRCRQPRIETSLLQQRAYCTGILPALVPAAAQRN